MPETLATTETEELDFAVAPLDLAREHAHAMAHLLSLPADVESYAECSDDELTRILGIVADQERIVAGHKSVLVGLVADRSRPELGLGGLAQQSGHRNAEEFIRHTTGATLTEVKRAVEVGRVVVEAAALPDRATGEIPDAVAPWLHGPARAMQAGGISAEHFRAIRDGLGQPEQLVTIAMLTEAATALLELARETDADRLRVLVRELRDEIDETGIRDREAKLRGQRSFRITRLPDGMSRVVWLLDPESAAVIHDIFDRATSPKLGGPRFVESERAAQADAIERDERTPIQLASDVMVELLRHGVDRDSSMLLGSELPAVRVVVTQEALESRAGHGVIEGANQAVSIATVERLACSGGTQDVLFDAEFRPLDVGRELRRYNKKQRIALAVRDGGCMMCDRPPSWCEAHHIKHWVRDRGETNIDDGILLCRRCHLRVHNEGWEITREGSTFWLIPPAAVDPARTPRPMMTRSRIMRELQRTRGGPDPDRVRDHDRVSDLDRVRDLDRVKSP